MLNNNNNKGYELYDEEDMESEERLLSSWDGVEKKRELYVAKQKRRKAVFTLGIILGCIATLILITGLVYGIRSRSESSKPSDSLSTPLPSQSSQKSTTVTDGSSAHSTAGSQSSSQTTQQPSQIQQKEQQKMCPPGFDPGSFDLSFFVIGDWGRAGNQNQVKAANMMQSVGPCYNPSFIISTGDNFYNHGLKWADDPFFKQTFTDVYIGQSLQVPWYAVLGNHDYGELSPDLVSSCSATSFGLCERGCCYSPVWQTNMTHMDSRWNLQQGAWKKTFLDGQLDIFFVDTPPYITRYQRSVWGNVAGGINSQNTTAQTAQIQAMLKASTARWRLMIGHHPIKSFGDHCNREETGECDDMQWLRPILAQNKVAAYFCGHEHDLQLIKDPDTIPNPDPVYYVVTGAGSDVREDEFDHIDKKRFKDAQYLSDDQGFVAVTIKGDDLMMDFWSGNTVKPAYQIKIPRSKI